MAALSLPDAKSHLNITTTDHDAELSDFIDAAQSRLEHDCGPFESVAKTARVRGGDELVLPATPVVSLTSVTPVGGSALTLADLHLESASGVVSYNLGGSFGSARYDVVYQAGRASVPDDLLMGLKELVRLCWSGSQRGGTRRPGSPPSDGYSNTLPGIGEDLPFAVQKWLKGHTQAGFA